MFAGHNEGAAAWLWAGWHFVALRYGTVNWVAPTLAWRLYAEAALLAGLGLSGRLAFVGPAAWAAPEGKPVTGSERGP